MTDKAKQLLIALILVIALALLIAWLAYPTLGQATMRYQKILADRYGWTWTWHAEKPYTVLSEICWDDYADTWCEALNLSRMVLLYEVIDHANDTRTTLYQLRRGQCIAWEWHNEYGADGQPHIAEANWITCP